MKRDVDLLQGSIYPAVLRFLLPFLLANIINSTFSAVDMAIVGLHGLAADTVAVTMGGRVMKICGYFAQHISVGAQVLIARRLGAGGSRGLRSSVGSVFILLFSVAVVLGALCLILADEILIWTNTPDDAFDQSLSYITAVALGMPLTFGFTCANGILQAVGRSRLMLLFTAVSTLINLILDFVFVVGLDMGAGGAAWATVAAQGAAFLLSACAIMRLLRSEPADGRVVRFDEMREIVKIAAPMVMASFCVQASQLFLTGYVNEFGLAEAATWGIAGNLVSYGTIFSMSMRRAGGIMVAQNLGSGNVERTRSFVHAELVITLAFVAGLTAVCLAFPEAVFSLFTNDAEVIASAGSFMWIVCLACWLAAFGDCWNTITTSSGFTVLTFVAGMTESLVLRVALGLFFGKHLALGAAGYFLGNALSRLAPLIVHGTYFFSGKWKKRTGAVR